LKKMKACMFTALLLILPSVLQAHDNVLAADNDENAVRTVLMQTWNKAGAPLIVEPVTIVDNYALAGWVQGERGGRALLMRKADGIWSVQLCAGDALKEVEMLKQSHISDAVANELVTRSATAEAALPAATRAQFSKFGATVHMAH
jgi:hypothetical protein